MRDELKGKASTHAGRRPGKPPVYESVVLNIDDSKGQGTHWVGLFVKGNECYYFDSFGFEPPLEVKEYCSEKDGYFSSYKIQSRDEVICGHYSIYVIYELNRGQNFHDILHELTKYSL